MRPRRFRAVAQTAAAFVALGVLAGCVETAIGAGATVGIAAYQERGVEGAARDLRISADIRERWFSFDHTLVTDLGIEVYESRAMLTGFAETEQRRADAVRLAWQANGVKDVINEIVIGDSDVVDTGRDVIITTTLEARITFDKQISAVNYSIETVGGVIYLIGIAQNQAELDRVIAHARDIDNVKRVVSHVRVKGTT